MKKQEEKKRQNRSDWNRRITGKCAGIAAFLLGIFLFALAGAQALQPTEVQAAQAGTEGKTYVLDQADLLTDEQEQALQKLCVSTSEACRTDVVVLTLKTGKDYSELDSYVRDLIAEDYGYNGSDGTPDAIVYVIDISSRADRIVTSGRAQTDISQTKLDHIRETAEKKISGISSTDNAAFYAAYKAYINGVNQQLNTSLLARMLMNLWIKLLIAAGVTAVVLALLLYHARSRMAVGCETYTRDHHFEVLQKTDQFINRTVVTHRINTGNGGGGGGGGGGNSGSSGGHF